MTNDMCGTKSSNIAALQGQNPIAMGAAHRKIPPQNTSALQGQNPTAMGAARYQAIHTYRPHQCPPLFSGGP